MVDRMMYILNKKLQLLTLFFAFTAKAFACWSPTYPPGEYYTFYAADYKQSMATVVY
jgi:hypothetical protein